MHILGDLFAAMVVRGAFRQRAHKVPETPKARNPSMVVQWILDFGFEGFAGAGEYGENVLRKVRANFVAGFGSAGFMRALSSLEGSLGELSRTQTSTHHGGDAYKSSVGRPTRVARSDMVTLAE